MEKDWKIERRTGVGGSDAAAILGLSPWKSEMDVWLEKKGLAEDKPDSNRQFLLELGTQLEPVIARLYERETGKHLQLPFPVRWKHPVHPILFGTPDRFVEGVDRGVELKSENQFMDQFGEPGTDQVPYHYLLQCAHYMAVTDYPVWDVALLHGGTRFSVFTIERDAELEKDMIDQLRQWWDRYIVGDRVPDVDSSSAWKVYLRKKFPVNLKPIKDSDEATLMLVNKLDAARRCKAVYDLAEQELETRLKLVIGEHDGIQGEFGKITWKKSKDWASVDYEAAFQLLAQKYGAPLEVVKDVLSQYTFPRPGSRRFLFTPKKGWIHGYGIGEQAAIGETAGAKGRELPDTVGEVQSGNRAGAAETPKR